MGLRVTLCIGMNMTLWIGIWLYTVIYTIVRAKLRNKIMYRSHVKVGEKTQNKMNSVTFMALAGQFILSGSYQL